jgi:hypothetical protein
VVSYSSKRLRDAGSLAGSKVVRGAAGGFWLRQLVNVEVECSGLDVERR